RTAILVLGQLGSCDDLPLLLSLTKHESVWIRRASVQVIGQLGCHEAVSHLVNLLGDETLNALAHLPCVSIRIHALLVIRVKVSHHKTLIDPRLKLLF
ncbi:MAG: HEAT repeat domain-containing protein, partial [Chloroflexota bacterium]